MVEQQHAAVEVWRAARTAAGEEPAPDRVTRVRGKITDPRAYLLVARHDDTVVGMALAEPFRAANGFGTVQPHHGHVSMVFVHPDSQGRGVGRGLVERLIEESPWPHLSLWTKGSLAPVRTLRRLGFRASGDTRGTRHGMAQRWERVGLEV